MSVIFLFIDGVGLGAKQKYNPFCKVDLKGFTAMGNGQPFDSEIKEVIEDGHVFKKADATLNIEGLPQSGTGQTSLFSGKNASKKIGKHFGPFPHSGIKHLLQEESLFVKAKAKGKKCLFINAYPDIFFQKAHKRNRWSCTTLMTKSADIPLNTIEEVKKGSALTAEITQEAWREQLGLKVPAISPEAAADRLLKQSKEYDIVLHEYYLTDKAGHNQEIQQALRYLYTYDRFLWHLMKKKKKEVTIVLSSDHGNIEDLSTKTHTFNPVPLYSFGPGASSFADVNSIIDITPAILKILS